MNSNEYSVIWLAIHLCSIILCIRLRLKSKDSLCTRSKLVWVVFPRQAWPTTKANYWVQCSLCVPETWLDSNHSHVLSLYTSRQLLLGEHLGTLSHFIIFFFFIVDLCLTLMDFLFTCASVAQLPNSNSNWCSEMLLCSVLFAQTYFFAS